MSIKTPQYDLAIANEAKAIRVRPASLKHWFKFDETTSGENFVDAITGAETSGVAFTTADGLVTLSGNITGALDSGSLVDLGTSDFLILFSGISTSNSVVTYGNFASGAHIQMASGIPPTRVSDGTTATITDDYTTATVNNHAIYSDGTNVGMIENGVLKGTVDPILHGPLTGVEDVIDITSGVKCSGYYVFVFANGLPEDYLEAAHFMGEMASQNKKVVWPSSLDWS